MNVVKGVFGIQDAPAAPDYTAAAKQTAEGNLAAAQYATQANRANQYNPYGSLTWEQGTDANGKPNNQWTQRVNLNETGQKLLDADNQTSLGLSGLQNQATQRVAQSQNQGWNDAALGDKGTALDPSKLAPMGTALSPQNYDFKVGSTGGSSVGDNTSYYDASKVGPTGRVYDPNQDTNTATQAILSRVNPQLDRRRAATESQLANQGITRGSEAWKNAMTDLGQQENDAFTQAGLQGINLGLTQQGQTYGQTMGNRNALSQDQQILANQQMGVRGQDIQQAGINTQAATNAAQMGLQAQIQAAQMAQNAQAQGFNQQNQLRNQGITEQGTQFGQQNALRNQGLQEQNYFANRDMNQLNALRTGSQVTNPTFQNYNQQATTSGADLLGASQAQYGAALGQTNANNAFGSNLMNGLFSIGATKIGQPSDIRLKTNIKKIGKYKHYNVYSYTKFGKHEIGVMAQEVIKTNPSAVHAHPNGYWAVDYEAL
jgi:Chaperone of endosialidase